jgi:hypothetical protein
VKYQPKTKPFKHQSRAVVRAVKARNFAIFFEPRLGKTKAALDVCGVWAMKRGGLKVLVLVPRIGLDVWEDEIEAHYPHFAMVEDFDQEWEHRGNTDYITQFFLAGREETMRATRQPDKSLYRPKQEIIEAWNPDLVVLDESHEYKRPGGRGAQDAWRMIRRLRKLRAPTGLPYVLLLSGTPNPKGWRDLFAQYRIMDDSIFGTSAELFDEEYVNYGHGSRRYSITGYRKEKQLIRKIRAHSIAVSADEAGLAGKKFWQSIRVDLPPRARKIYEEMAEEFLTEWKGSEIDAKNAGVKRLRLLQICGGFTTAGDQIHREKVTATKDYLSNLLDQGEKVVAYARFSPEVESIRETAERVGYRTHMVAGATTRLDGRRAIQDLQRSTDPVAIVFQVQAGSQSIELSAAAEVLYFSTPDGWVDYWQSLHRVLGPNQNRPVRYTHILARRTVDLGTVAGLRRKEDWHATMMRNPRRYLLGF